MRPRETASDAGIQGEGAILNLTFSSRYAATVPDDDLPPLEASTSDAPAKPGFWARFLGPENAAGLGGWAGVFGPMGAIFLFYAFLEQAAGRPAFPPATVYGLICAASASLLLGVGAGGVGGRLVRFVERRRGASWPPWRAQFVGGFVAGVLTVLFVTVVGVTNALI
ncbi:hypothetical protein [Alienimonas chondri]|uniref:DUF4190 domain-containing protein n=1 Tax=Alienimonas chondri TaxID=2681879 RepID=A0ABX1VAQ5_9PLAN|nr:hypothetical protein [Alienimonas chondri]NNJ25153.1 hypothetical protein [Alienimonas chondri]